MSTFSSKELVSGLRVNAVARIDKLLDLNDSRNASNAETNSMTPSRLWVDAHL